MYLEWFITSHADLMRILILAICVFEFYFYETKQETAG